MKKIYIIVAIVIIAVGGYFYYHNKSKTKNQTQYTTEKIEKGTISSFVTGSGNVFVDETANINPSISGTIKNLNVKVGDLVFKDQALFTIDSPQTDIDLAKAYNSYLSTQQATESAKSQFLQSQLDYETLNQQNDVKQGSVPEAQLSISRQKFITNQASYEVAQNNVNAAYLSYQSALKTASDKNVKTPISGIVANVNVKNGDDLGGSTTKSSTNASTTSTSLTSTNTSISSANIPIIIQNLKTRKAKIAVNEVDIAKIKLDQKATLTFDAIDGLTLTGKVEQMDNMGTITNSVVNYNVVIAFDTLDDRVKPEMSTSASIITDTKVDVLVAPNAAVKTNDNSHYVQVLTNGAPEQKPVEIGIVSDSKTEIKSGINEGEEVVTQTVSVSSSGAITTAARRGNSPFGGLPGVGGQGR